MLERINKQNSALFDKLVQEYEDEFSYITGKKKDENGNYAIDVSWHEPNIGYYWKEGSKVIGFCIKTFINGYSDIGEFYILPHYRNKRAGHKMAFAVFNKHPGSWQVRQIERAELAKIFWRRVINEYTKGAYIEEEANDPKWGRVTCQRFESQKETEN
jgi:predicted acetyltransferase